MIIKSAPLGELGANFYMVTDEASGEMFVVDPGAYGEMAVKLIKDSGSTLKYIIITHAHTDHIGALDDIKKAFDVPVIIHEDDSLALNDSHLNMCAPFGINSPVTKADITVRDSSTLPFGSTQIRFIHTPGHTRGSMCILAGNALFSGDTLFEYSIGRTDFPGGSFTEIRHSIQNKLYTLDPETIVYPGHGNTTSIRKEMKNNPFV